MQWFRNRNVRGRPPHPDVLTPAEWRVLEHVRAGRSNPEIARRLDVSVNTVRTHVSSMLAKLELPDRHALARWDGEPEEVSRVALRRFALAAPFAWLREVGAGKMAAGASVVAVSVAAIVVMSQLQGGDGAVATATPSPPATATTTETGTPGVEPTPDPGPGAHDLPFAPAGRTGDPAVDDLIEALLTDDAATLAQRFAGVEAREYFTPESPSAPYREEVWPVDVWAERLVNADRSLYAVVNGLGAEFPARDAEISFAVTEAGGEPREWAFAISRGAFVDIVIREPGSLEFTAARVGYLFERFVVLPPPEDLPQPPAGHALDVRSGDASVDQLLALIEGRDAAGLAAAVAYAQRPCEPGSQPPCAPGTTSGETDALALRRCGQADAWIAPAIAEARLVEIAAETARVHAVAAIPAGYRPAADHLVMLVRQVDPYRWETTGIFARDGAIVGLYLECSEVPQSMYPPSAFVLAPPDDGFDGLDPSRTAGIAAIDETLAALRTGNATALDALADWQEMACIADAPGMGGPPVCRDGEAPGTLIEVLPVSQCEGGPARRGELGETWALLASPGWQLYTVADIGSPNAASFGWPAGQLDVTVADPDTGAMIAFSFSDEGFVDIWFGCGPGAPEQLLRPGRAPVFLLPPP